MGREHGEHKAVKERCRCEARSAYLFPNVFRCSCRTPHPTLSRRVGIHPHLILAAIPRTSENTNIVPGRDVHDRSSRMFGYLTDRLRTIFPRAALALQKDHRYERSMLGGLEAGQRRGATIPCKVSGGLTIRSVAEALRSQSRGSQRASEVYSPTILKLVRGLVSPTSTTSVPPPCPRG
jgi:hypothetical protein